MSHLVNFRLATLKAAVVLIPSYSAAYFTDKMVWVVPTLAAAGFFAANIKIAEETTIRRVDEDGDTDDEGDEAAIVEFGEISGGS
ncbi:MAG: hypothetical protein H6878_05050 [Rhodobiaceae bacterium]|nr:hypothetical protein [Rhodobiaceae bacterium]MCC0015658.1 hypothetical protein [Rhodobiaceae bacterium]